MRSIGQKTPISHNFGRYGLGDTDKSLYESTTSINRWRMIRLISMKVSKGMELPVVALPGVGHMPAAGEDEQEAARVFYVAATRATQRLVIGVGGDGKFFTRMQI
jgi:superfamily I DNA/RNA helicase